MKIFITGITGYVGRNLAKYFTEKGHSVSGLSRNSMKSNALEENGIKIIKGDLESKSLETELRGFDIVIHAAADTDHKNISCNQYQTNVLGTKSLLQKAKKANVKRFIHISTDSVILNGKSILNATEDFSPPQIPVGEYSSTKKIAEETVLQEANANFEVIILRPRFIWGRDDTTATPQIIKAITSNQFAWIDKGNYLTSMTHIENFCHGVECSIKKGRSKEIYFLSDDDDRSFKEIISSIIKTHGCEIPQKSVPRFIPFIIACLDNVRRKLLPSSTPLPLTMQEYATSAVAITLDISKAKKELGYIPKISFEDGIKELNDKDWESE